MKLEKVAEIKKITSKMVAIKRYKLIVWLDAFHNSFIWFVYLFSLLTILFSDISRYEDILKEYKKYKEFLLMLSPPEWQEKQRSKSRRSTDSTNTESDGKQTEKIKKNRERKTVPPDNKRMLAILQAFKLTFV